MRLHLFEFLDQSWLPEVFRRPMTGFLTEMYKVLPCRDQLAEETAQFIKETGQTRVIDIGSGAGGPLLSLSNPIMTRVPGVRITLTDLFPDQEMAAQINQVRDSGFEYLTTPVDAVHVPDDLDGVRTLFTVFHHFAPELARAVLRDAFNQRQPVMIWDPTRRSLFSVLTSFVIPISALFILPRVKPLRLSTLLLTYVLPLLPLMIWWDGFVSHLRTYSVRDLQALTSDLRADDYQWIIKDVAFKGVPYKLTVLYGESRPCDSGR